MLSLSIDIRRTRDEHSRPKAGAPQSAQQMMRAEHVGSQRRACFVPRRSHVRGTGTVKDRRRPKNSDRPFDRPPIEQVDILTTPASHRRAGFSEKIEEMAACESSRARYQDVAQDADLAENGGHLLSRSESVGEETGQSMARAGSFHMNPDSCSAAYSFVIM